jgi:hypothetical protein
MVVLVGCGGGGGTGDDGDDGDDGTTIDADPAAPDADPTAPDADPTAPDADPNVTWETLISSDWTLAAGQERYWCATVTLPADTYAHAMRPIGPPGTHHTVISLNTPSGPDNPGFSCGPEFGEFWASGYGTQPLVLPPGVGLLAPGGMQLRMSLHLFNATDGPLSGTSGLEIQRMNPADVVHTASVTYHGPLVFAIPSNNQPHTVTHTIGVGDRNIVAIFPHMHQLGTHFRARLTGANPTMLWDQAYQFESQEFSAVLPVVPTAGSMLETQCTWVNNTGGTVTWGDSSNAEMCFTILMSY